MFNYNLPRGLCYLCRFNDLNIIASIMCQQFKLQIVLFDSHEKKGVSAMINNRSACRVSECGKNFNTAIFLDTINVSNVTLWMMVLLIELFLLIPLSVTVTIFQGQRSVKQF